MKVLTIFFLVFVSTQVAAWEGGKNCRVKITNPEFNNMILANQCIDFPDDISDSTYKMAKGLCQPEWDGMDIKVDYVSICEKSTNGRCRFSFHGQPLNFSYTVFFYSAPPATSQDNKQYCLAGGGEWLHE